MYSPGRDCSTSPCPVAAAMGGGRGLRCDHARPPYRRGQRRSSAASLVDEYRAPPVASRVVRRRRRPQEVDDTVGFPPVGRRVNIARGAFERVYLSGVVISAASRPRRRRATATMIKPMMESCLLVVRRSPWGCLVRLVGRNRLDIYAAASSVRYISARWKACYETPSEAPSRRWRGVNRLRGLARHRRPM